MANYGFLTTRYKLTADRVHADILDIVRIRFRDLLQVQRRDFNKRETLWGVQPKRAVRDAYMYEFEARLLTPHKMQFRHPPNQWAFWAQVVITNDLALRYNGLISDEGVCEKWRGKPGVYPTYRSWLLGLYRTRMMIEQEMSDLDPVLDKFDKSILHGVPIR